MDDADASGPVERFSRIAEDGLCIGCGLCQSVAGPEVIRMAMTPAGAERPVVRGALGAETVDLIYDVCPGTRVEGLPEALVDRDGETDAVWGPFLRLARAYAGEPAVRYRGSTGGVLSALALYLLESGRVEFILHAKASESHPTWGERHLSLTAEDVLAGAGSRYGPTAPLIDVDAVLGRGRPFAFVGKPCDIAALRNLARHDPRVDALCRIMLTPVCGGFLEPQGMRRFLAGLGIDEGAVTRFDYRGNGCPGPTRIETRDGRVIEMNYLDMWGEDDSAWSLPFRCKICPDGIGEAADIAASDTWPGGAPSWEGQAEDPGVNGVMVRTRAGLELFEAAVRDGALVVDGEITPRDLDLYQPHQVDKKRAAWARHLGLRRAGKLAPGTERLRIAELAKEAGVAANLTQARGTLRRAREGKTGEPRPEEA